MQVEQFENPDKCNFKPGFYSFVAKLGTVVMKKQQNFRRVPGNLQPCRLDLKKIKKIKTSCIFHFI